MPNIINHPLYPIWKGIKYRCHNTSNRDYFRYGARGISVCERWRKSFMAFIADMGPRPSPAHSIDRIDNNGNYEPGNCRWATREEQQRNTRNTRYITANGMTMCISDWAERLGVTRDVIHHRLGSGWSEQDAVTVAKGQRP